MPPRVTAAWKPLLTALLLTAILTWSGAAWAEAVVIGQEDGITVGLALLALSAAFGAGTAWATTAQRLRGMQDGCRIRMQAHAERLAMAEAEGERLREVLEGPAGVSVRVARLEAARPAVGAR